MFCRIVKDVTQASLVYSAEKVLAFMDIRPAKEGHVLVIPRVHASRLEELDEEVGAQVFRVTMSVVKALYRSGLRCEGVNLHLADGEVAGQEVPHVHLYVIPRFRGDNFGIRFGRKYGSMPHRKDLDAVAFQIKKVMS